MDVPDSNVHGISGKSLLPNTVRSSVRTCQDFLVEDSHKGILFSLL